MGLEDQEGGGGGEVGCSLSYGGALSKERGILTSVIDAAAGQPQTRDESAGISRASTYTSEHLE
jgi:hypothetical protein